MRKLKNLQDVVDWGLCIGCGACYSACDKGGVSLVDIESVGIRPQFNETCGSCTKCLPICPGYTVDGTLEIGPLPIATQADHEFGPALEIWEGYAADPEIRYKGSSGGVLSALSLYCLEQEEMEFVLHSGMDPEQPWKNKTFVSKTPEEILARTGSRYAPSSPCEGLREIENSKGVGVFIGKPCDTAAVSALRRQQPELDEKIGLVLTFFCAGTPSTQGTLELAELLNVQSDAIDSVRYRGEGWPGRFKITYANGLKEESLSYQDSWGRLTKHRPLRCNLCPDGLGRVADISCGDAWNKFTDETGDIGRSVVIVRTQRGREILHRAIAANYIELKPVESTAVLTAQENLLGRRRELFGRLLGMRLLLVPTPKFIGLSLFHSWIRLPSLKKVKSLLGAMWRIVQRGLWKRKRLAKLPSIGSLKGSLTPNPVPYKLSGK